MNLGTVDNPVKIGIGDEQKICEGINPLMREYYLRRRQHFEARLKRETAHIPPDEIKQRVKAISLRGTGLVQYWIDGEYSFSIEEVIQL